MDMFVNDEVFDIDVEMISEKIDDILHEHITEQAGITFNHSITRRHIVTLIDASNIREIKLKKFIESGNTGFRKYEREVLVKRSKGRIVDNLDTWLNRVRHNHFGWLLRDEWKEYIALVQ